MFWVVFFSFCLLWLHATFAKSYQDTFFIFTLLLLLLLLGFVCRLLQLLLFLLQLFVLLYRCCCKYILFVFWFYFQHMYVIVCKKCKIVKITKKKMLSSMLEFIDDACYYILNLSICWCLLLLCQCWCHIICNCCLCCFPSTMTTNYMQFS